MTVIQSYNSKNTPSGKVYAVKIAEALLLYVFRMVFPTSPLSDSPSPICQTVSAFPNPLSVAPPPILSNLVREKNIWAQLYKQWVFCNRHNTGQLIVHLFLVLGLIHISRLLGRKISSSPYLHPDRVAQFRVHLQVLVNHHVHDDHLALLLLDFVNSDDHVHLDVATEHPAELVSH